MSYILLITYFDGETKAYRFADFEITKEVALTHVSIATFAASILNSETLETLWYKKNERFVA